MSIKIPDVLSLQTSRWQLQFVENKDQNYDLLVVQKRLCLNFAEAHVKKDFIETVHTKIIPVGKGL